MHFVLPILFVLTMAFDRAVLHGNNVFSVLVMSSKKQYSSFFKITSKICFKVTTLKTFKISSDCPIKTCQSRGGSRDFEKGEGALYLGQRKFSKRAKRTLETIRFWQDISISIFKFSSFLYTMKACGWNLINFSKFANALIWKEKDIHTAVNEKRQTEKRWTLFYNRLFYKAL